MRHMAAIAAALIISAPAAAGAQQHEDTVPRRLREVLVTARAPKPAVIPAQTLSGDELRRLNSNSVADALRYFAGVQVKDYGGVGGIKTVNVRSMGTNHTAVSYDGIELGNAQLQPERVTQYNFGVLYDNRGSGLIAAA
ncbi:MAG: Plug domain-containing protein [Muribaculaceae bacterium]|nr:Plug domain-containing protein [Muribaculaceae bacterium]